MHILLPACIALAAWGLVWIIGRDIQGCVCECRQGRKPCSCNDRRKHQTAEHPLRRKTDWPEVDRA